MKQDTTNLDDVFSALSSPIRRSIIEQVSIKECTVNELAEKYEVSREAISQHLHTLIDAGLIEQTKFGRIRQNSLNPKPLSTAFNWLVRYRIFWENFLDDIQEKLESNENTTEENHNVKKKKYKENKNKNQSSK